MGFFKKKQARDMYDLRPDSELRAEKDSQKTLSDSRLEAYANELVDIYERDGGDKNMDFETNLRPIGEAINDKEKMVLVAYRAEFIARAKGSGLVIRHLEYAWDGIAGWMH